MQNCFTIVINADGRTCIELLLAFAIATKYRLRRQPSYDHPDLQPLIENLSTLAKSHFQRNGTMPSPRRNKFLLALQSLGVSFARPIPRPLPSELGNLPLEILTYISAYLQSTIDAGACTIPLQGQILAAIGSMSECLTGMERILATPLPLGFRIAISQITWLYILILPFQLLPTLDWVAIPGTVGSKFLRRI